MTTSSLVSAPATVTSAPARTWELETFRGADGLAAIREDWTRITDQSVRARFFQRWEWHAAHLSSLAERASDSHYFLMRRHGVPVGVVPLIRTTRKVAGLKLRSLELPHDGHMLLGDFAWAPGSDEHLIIAELIRHLSLEHMRWDILCLPGLLDDGCARRALLACGRRLVRLEDQGGCDYLPCVPFEELAATFSKNFRGNLRKARNKLARVTGVEYVTAQNVSELEAALPEFFDVEASGWKGTGGTQSAIKLNRRLVDFYQALAAHFGRHGACEINLLRAEGRCLAAQFCLLAGDTGFILKIGYDEAYAHVAPGNMLLEHTLRRHAAAGVLKYVNLVTDTSWHASWNPQSLRVFDGYLFNRTPAGLAAFCLEQGARLARETHASWTKLRRARAASGREPVSPAQLITEKADSAPDGDTSAGAEQEK